MSIVRVGTTKKYADGWDAIFGNKKKPSGRKSGAAESKSQKRAAQRKRK